MSGSESHSEFGRYPLSPGFLAARSWIGRRPAGRATRLLASGLRRLLLSRGGAVFDLEILPGVRARIYPRGNRCEKAVLTGAQFWDAEERAILAREIRAGPAEQPFVFVDVGANVGFYSLFASAAAQSCGRPIQVLAIEPDGENRRRFQTNVALNGFEAIQILPIGVGEASGRGVMAGGERNRGERRLVPAAEGDVEIVSLAEALRRAGVTAVDCMKVDIEGDDLAVLRAFFAAAPAESWPKLLIVELAAGTQSAMSELCTRNGYVPEARTRLNAIFRRPPRSA